MKRSMILIGLVSAFLFSSQIYALPFMSDSVNQNTLEALGRLTTGSKNTDSKEIKNRKNISSDKDKKIKDSKKNKSASNIMAVPGNEFISGYKYQGDIDLTERG